MPELAPPGRAPPWPEVELKPADLDKAACARRRARSRPRPLLRPAAVVPRSCLRRPARTPAVGSPRACRRGRDGGRRAENGPLSGDLALSPAI